MSDKDDKYGMLIFLPEIYIGIQYQSFNRNGRWTIVSPELYVVRSFCCGKRSRKTKIHICAARLTKY